MNPYLQAFEIYHRFGEPGFSWREAMEIHLQYGTVISTDTAFIMARRVRSADPDAVHLALSPLQSPVDSDCWNIWVAAGRLDSLLSISEAFPTPWVSYCRRDSTELRRYRTTDLFRHHVFSKSSEADSAPTTG